MGEVPLNVRATASVGTLLTGIRENVATPESADFLKILGFEILPLLASSAGPSQNLMNLLCAGDAGVPVRRDGRDRQPLLAGRRRVTLCNFSELPSFWGYTSVCEVTPVIWGYSPVPRRPPSDARLYVL